MKFNQFKFEKVKQVWKGLEIIVSSNSGLTSWGSWSPVSLRLGRSSLSLRCESPWLSRRGGRLHLEQSHVRWPEGDWTAHALIKTQCTVPVLLQNCKYLHLAVGGILYNNQGDIENYFKEKRFSNFLIRTSTKFGFFLATFCRIRRKIFANLLFHTSIFQMKWWCFVDH